VKATGTVCVSIIVQTSVPSTTSLTVPRLTRQFNGLKASFDASGVAHWPLPWNAEELAPSVPSAMG